MDTWLTALIAAGGALAGSGMTGVITSKIARREHEARDVDELRAALMTYGAILDRLGLRIDQMPHAPGLLGAGPIDRSLAGAISTGRSGESPPPPSAAGRSGRSTNSPRRRIG